MLSPYLDDKTKNMSEYDENSPPSSDDSDRPKSPSETKEMRALFASAIREIVRDEEEDDDEDEDEDEDSPSSSDSSDHAETFAESTYNKRLGKFKPFLGD